MDYLPDLADIISRLKQPAEPPAQDLHRWNGEIYSSDDALLKNTGPICLGPAQELESKPHAYMLKDVWQESWILRRGADLRLQAQLNRCRHRGMRLLHNPKGSAQNITCPYHAWSYDENGQCKAIAQQAAAFPTLKAKDIRLETRPAVEIGGLMWLMPAVGGENALAPLTGHFKAWGLGSHLLHASIEQTVPANWKLLQEAFLEAYHVPFIHAKTLAPATQPFRWLLDFYGSHSRAVYPLKRLQDDPDCKKAPLRRYLSVVYQIFPNTLISFQPFHALVTRFMPAGTGTTHAQISVLVRPEDLEQHPKLVERDIEFVKLGLFEDFANAAQIQLALASGPQELVSGAFETQIAHFHSCLTEARGRTI